MSFTMAPASSLLSSRSAVSVRGSRAAQVQGARRPSLARSQSRSGRVTGAPLSVRAVVMDPGEQSKPRTEAIQNNTNPWSAESAVPVNKKARGEPVRIKIDAQWYDARGWALAHPGGERWIHFFDGRDATDVFYALHSYGPNGSSKAVDRLAKLPKCDAPPPKELKKPTPSEYATSMSFRDFRGKLEKDGFFERNVFKEAWALVSVLGLYVSGQYFAYSNPCVSEEIMEYGEGSEYVGGQFRSTRDAETVFGPLETWIWGGMDTQLEHHLFPTMPRYRYHALRPILKAWAAANNIAYRSSPSTKIISDNFNLLKTVAAAP